MKFADCAQAILEGKKLRLVLPHGYKVLNCQDSNIYIGAYEDGRLISIYNADPNDLDWEVIE